MSKSVKPFTFSNLPKVSRGEVELANSLLPHLGFFKQQTDLQAKLEETLRALVGEKVGVALESMSFISSDQYAKLIETGSCVAVVDVPPQRGFFFVETENQLAKSIVYRVLGGNSASGGLTPLLSEVEQGIFSFAMLKLLDASASSLNSDVFGKFQLAHLGSGFDAVSPYLEQPGPLALFGFSLSMEKSRSFFRIALSSELIHSLSKSLHQSDARVDAIVKTGLQRSTGVNISVIAEVGHVSLKPNDLSTLDVDDIIVLEGSSVHLRELGLVGNLRCKIGESEYGSFMGSLLLTKSGRYAVQVSDLVAAYEPNANQKFNPANQVDKS